MWSKIPTTTVEPRDLEVVQNFDDDDNDDQPLVGQRLVDQRLVDQPLVDQPLVDQPLVDHVVKNVPDPACNDTGGEQRWSKISTTTACSNHLGHLWCCDFDDDGSPNDQVYPTAKHQG